MTVNILCIGDLVGGAGRDLLAEHLASFIADHNVDFVVCNAENVAGGSGLTPAIFEEIVRHGVDVVTMGDHVYRRREIIPILESSSRIVRPTNLSRQAAGKRWTVVETKSGCCSVGVACVLGQMFMKPADSPWASVDQCLGEMDDDVRIRIIDFHAEASSEKIAMGWHLNGRVSVVFGTHTHIPTADSRILDKGTAYISDLGMTGPYDSVLGRRKDHVLKALTTSMRVRFDVARGDPRMCGILVGVEAATGKAVSIERVEVSGRVQEEAYHEDGSQ